MCVSYSVSITLCWCVSALLFPLLCVDVCQLKCFHYFVLMLLLDSLLTWSIVASSRRCRKLFHFLIFCKFTYFKWTKLYRDNHWGEEIPICADEVDLQWGFVQIKMIFNGDLYRWRWSSMGIWTDAVDLQWGFVQIQMIFNGDLYRWNWSSMGICTDAVDLHWCTIRCVYCNEQLS